MSYWRIWQARNISQTFLSVFRKSLVIRLEEIGGPVRDIFVSASGQTCRCTF
jgi:hypothetical protein